MKTAIRILLFTLLLGMTVYFNIGLVDIRVDEIRYLLGKIASQQDVTNTFGIIAKYELIKRRMLYGEENITNYELEAKIQALTSGDQLEQEQNTWQIKLYRIPVRMMLNSIRFLLGKEIISPREDDKILHVLEIAYFWERNRNYNEATKLYNDVLTTRGLTNEIRAAVMVHKAFCLSMNGEYEASKLIYEAVINSYPNTEAGVLSWKLLDFIQSMEKERTNLDQTKLNDLDKAKQFYLLMDFRNAVKNFSIFLEKIPVPTMAAEARFYKGRSHEELGEAEDAMAEYREVMRIDSSKVWARQANRRMLMLGEFYSQKKQVADEARKQLTAYQDQVFMNNVDKYKSMVSNSSLRDELMKEPKQAQAKRNRADDSLLSLINSIGDLDLTGEKEAKKHFEEIAKAQQELIASGRLSPAEMKEIQRRQSLAQSPFRRPSLLKKVIDENSSELRYIYNKRLRAGVSLSGKMLVEIRIAANGSVTSAKVINSSMGDQTFEQEVMQKILTWRFAGIQEELGELTVNYPFEFTQEK
jgi:TonB family protein